jgi:hypothetical protein
MTVLQVIRTKLWIIIDVIACFLGFWKAGFDVAPTYVDNTSKGSPAEEVEIRVGHNG